MLYNGLRKTLDIAKTKTEDFLNNLFNDDKSKFSDINNEKTAHRKHKDKNLLYNELKISDELPIYYKAPRKTKSSNNIYNLYKFITTKNLKYANYLSKKLSKSNSDNLVNNYKFNNYDMHLWNISQLNKGIITDKAIKDYASTFITSKKDIKQFVNQCKIRAYTLMKRGSIFDISNSKYTKHIIKNEYGKFEFHARKNIKYKVTKQFFDDVEMFRESARNFRLNTNRQMILELFSKYNSIEEVEEKMLSYFSSLVIDEDTIKNTLYANIYQLEKYGYLINDGGFIFTEIDFDFNVKMDNINVKLLEYAYNNELTVENASSAYDFLHDVEIEEKQIMASWRIALLKHKGLINLNNSISTNGIVELKNYYSEVKDKLNNNFAKTVLNMKLQGYSDDRVKDILNKYRNKDIEKNYNYVINKYRDLKYIDNNNNVTSKGIMFLEQYRIEKLNFLDRQIINSIINKDYSFSNVKLKDATPETIQKICNSRAMNLLNEGYLSIGKNYNFLVTDKGLDFYYKYNYKITRFDKTLLEASKNGVIEKEQILNYYKNLGHTDEEAISKYNIIEKRLNTHVHNKMIKKDGDKYILTDEFIKALGETPSKVKKEFNFTEYDRNILSYIDKKIFSKDKIVPKLKEIYGEEAETKYYIMRSRAKKLIKEGYVKTNENDFYTLTDKGIKELNKFNYNLNYYDYKYFIEPSINNIFSKKFYYNYLSEKGFLNQEIEKDFTKLNTRLELHLNSGLIEKIDDDLYLITDEFLNKFKSDFIDKKEFSFSKFDSFILNSSENRIISVNKYLSNFSNLESKNLYNKEKMFRQRCLLLEKEGFISKLDEDKYLVTDKSIEFLKNRKLQLLENKIKPLKIGRFDKQIYDFIKNNNSESFKLSIFEQIEDERLKKMMLGRVRKLNENGYIVKLNDEYMFAKDFEKELFKNKNNTPKEIKINRYDVNKIFRNSENYIISKELFKKKYFGNNLDRDIAVFNKRLENLYVNGYLTKLDDGSYKLNDKFITKAREHEKKLISRLNKDKLNLCENQKFILNELRQFLNITQEQLNKLGDFQLEITNLYNRGLIDYVNREVNGINTKVFYLTKEGKQITSKFTGVEVKDMHDSKLHHRPEELEHDVLVYSAYQDAKIRLLAKNKIVTNIQLDRDMRRDYMKNHGNMPVQMPDLRVEYRDISTGETGYINIEVDLGYNKNVIADKSNNIDNLVWYTNSEGQKNRILSVNPSSRVIML